MVDVSKDKKAVKPIINLSISQIPLAISPDNKAINNTGIQSGISKSSLNIGIGIGFCALQYDFIPIVTIGLSLLSFLKTKA